MPAPNKRFPVTLLLSLLTIAVIITVAQYRSGSLFQTQLTTTTGTIGLGATTTSPSSGTTSSPTGTTTSPPDAPVSDTTGGISGTSPTDSNTLDQGTSSSTTSDTSPDAGPYPGHPSFPPLGDTGTQPLSPIESDDLTYCPALNEDPEITRFASAYADFLRTDFNFPEPTLAELAQANPILTDQDFGVPDEEGQRPDLTDPAYQRTLLAQVNDTYQTNWDIDTLTYTDLGIPEIPYIQGFLPFTQTINGIPTEDPAVILKVGDSLLEQDTLINHYAHHIIPQEATVSESTALTSLTIPAGITPNTELLYVDIPGEDSSSHTLAYKVTFDGTIHYIDATTGDTIFTKTDNSIQHQYRFFANPKDDCELQLHMGSNICQDKQASECDPRIGANIGGTVPPGELSGEDMNIPLTAANFTNGTITVIAKNESYPIKKILVEPNYFNIEDAQNNAPKDKNGDPYQPDTICIPAIPRQVTDRQGTALMNLYGHLTDPSLVLAKLLNNQESPPITATILPTAAQLRSACSTDDNTLACTIIKKDTPIQQYYVSDSALDTEVIVHETAHAYMSISNPTLAYSDLYEAAVLREGIAYTASVIATDYRDPTECDRTCPADRRINDPNYAKCVNANRGLDPCIHLKNIPQPAYDICYDCGQQLLDQYTQIHGNTNICADVDHDWYCTNIGVFAKRSPDDPRELCTLGIDPFRCARRLDFCGSRNDLYDFVNVSPWRNDSGTWCSSHFWVPLTQAQQDAYDACRKENNTDDDSCAYYTQCYEWREWREVDENMAKQKYPDLCPEKTLIYNSATYYADYAGPLLGVSTNFSRPSPISTMTPLSLPPPSSNTTNTSRKPAFILPVRTGTIMTGLMTVSAPRLTPTLLLSALPLPVSPNLSSTMISTTR
jgi:hypothetical protein